MKVLFIYNPSSGNNRKNPRLLSVLKERCANARVRTRVEVTRHPGHATELASKAASQGYDRIVAVGGDGTMNETAQGVVGTKAALGLVPCGSGNGLALHLRIPTDREQAVSLALDEHARVRTMDTGMADHHPFFNAMGLGLDAEISLRFNRLTRRGLPAYVKTTLGAFLRHKPADYTLTSADGKRLSLRATILAVANSDQYGNNARIAPHARVDDGLLNLVALRPLNPFSALDVACRLFSGSLDRSRHAHCLEASSFVIDRASPGPLHVDGETREAGTRIRVSLKPRSLRILVPRNRS